MSGTRTFGVGTKIGITVAVVVGALGYMIYATVSTGEALQYYKHVHEVMQQPEKWRGAQLQLHGNVVAGTLAKKDQTLDFRFGLHRGGRWVDVAYGGLLPDGLKDCAELVVTGRLGPDATFSASSIATKCPSKYDGKQQPGVCGERHSAPVLASRAGGAQR